MREALAAHGRRTWRHYTVLAVLAALLGALRLAMGHRPAAQWIADHLTTPYKRAVGALCSLLPFSMAEVCWAALIIFCAVYVGKAVRALARGKGRRGGILWRRALGGCAVALAVYLGYTLLWGVNYYTATFEEQAGLAVRPVYVQQLAAVTGLFAEKLNAVEAGVARDETGVFNETTDDIFAASAALYCPLEAKYPFLQTAAVRPKSMAFSKVLSAMEFTGFFFPFTGEANLNTDAPACLLPATVAHELSHVRGVAPEQTANFVGILACDTSGIPIYEYSGALLAYIHLSNALYGADRARWEAVSGTLHPHVLADLAANNAYWAQYEKTVASRAANGAYNNFLKSYGQSMGVKSYGAVVDLLVAYYAPLQP